MRELTVFASFFTTGLILLAAGISLAGFDEDPLKETQSNFVPVTDELLKREGQSGPASPTYPMVDTSGFMVQMPYGKAEEYETGSEEKSSDRFWDRWFFWKKEEKEKEISEPIENE